MKVGHICLATTGGTEIERFAQLVEAISQFDVAQHVLVASHALGRRLAKCANVTVGPIVRSPVMAYCLMPQVDLAHVHDGKSGQAGLLLTLTRSIPFVITADDSTAANYDPLSRSVLNRAVCRLRNEPNTEPNAQAARRHLNVYAGAVSGRLEFPEKSNSGQ